MRNRIFISVNRLAALVDGVLAIVLTLMVVLIEPIEPGESSEELIQDFLRVGHIILAYALSFVLISIYWFNHYAIFQHLKRASFFLVY